MSFFPADPEMPEPDEEETTRSPWWNAPTDLVPVLYPVSELLASTDHVAVAIVGVAVYADGAEIRVERRLRRNGLPFQDWQELSSTFMEHWSGPRTTSAGRLRYGVVLSDGEQVLGDSLFGVAGDPSPPSGSSLARSGGGGSGDGHSFSSSDTLWLWPLPPPGSLEFVMQWPAVGIDETRTYLDASSIRELAGRSVPFWPSADD